MPIPTTPDGRNPRRRSRPCGDCHADGSTTPGSAGRRPPPREEPMKLKKGFRELVDEAKAHITTLSLEEARARHGQDDVVFVDLRDVRELEREGMIPGAFHCPRGMLEFWIDPDSPYHKP